MDQSEVLSLYGGLHVPMHVMDNLLTTSKWKLTQFLDMFSLPEATLYADVSQVSPIRRGGACMIESCLWHAVSAGPQHQLPPGEPI